MRPRPRSVRRSASASDETIRELREEGVASVYVSHQLDEVLAFATGSR